MERKDFIGFTFDSKHSDDLGIVRVSDGDRYKEELQPEIGDISSDVPGMDGEYYFGSNYKKKEFDIEIAYDSLTEQQLRELRRLFSGREIHELIFDERPYKKYLVKLASPISLSYVCFDEEKKVEVPFDGIKGPTTVLRPTGETERIYKGDGTINLVAYYPFAKSTLKFISEYRKTEDTEIIAEKDYYEKIGGQYELVSNPVVENLENYYEHISSSELEQINEWADSSGLLTEFEYDSFDTYVNGKIQLYNAGDIATGIKIYCPFTDQETQNLVITYMDEDAGIQFSLDIQDIQKIGDDKGFMIDTQTQLIRGVRSTESEPYELNNNLYNYYLKAGTFFKVAPAPYSENNPYLNITGGNENMKVFYDYLYL